MMTDNGGIFVCRTRHLVLAGGSKVSIAQFRCFLTHILYMLQYVQLVYMLQQWLILIIYCPPAEHV